LMRPTLQARRQVVAARSRAQRDRPFAQGADGALRRRITDRFCSA
jgi:hypothetical protein